jgi:hypothetical protein
MKHLNIFINEKLYIRKNKKKQLSDEIADLLIENLIDINKVNINSFAISKSRFTDIDSYTYILYRDNFLSEKITFEDLNIDIFDDVVDIKCIEAKGFHKTLYKNVYTVSNIEQGIIIEIYIDSNDYIKEIAFSKNIYDAILNKKGTT